MDLSELFNLIVFEVLFVLDIFFLIFSISFLEGEFLFSFGAELFELLFLSIVLRLALVLKSFVLTILSF
jgi:hypothetical protein